MKNQVIIIVILIVLAVAGFWGYNYLQSSSPATSPQSKSSQQLSPSVSVSSSKPNQIENGQKTEPAAEENLIVSGMYIDYSKTGLDSAASGRRVLFFYADWCPTCRAADPDFKTNVRLFPKDLTLIKVNYNDDMTDADEKELAKKYGVTYQHTFVQIDSSGKEITKWNGGKTAELFQNIKQ